MRIRLPLIRAQEKVVVEINSYYLKMAFFKGAKLQWWEYRPVEKLSDRDISRMIKQIFETRGVKPVRGIFVLSRDLLKVGILHLPSVNEQEITSMVGINALRQVPYHKDEIVLGWRVTSTEGGYSDVLLAICQKNLIRRYIVILETAGLSVEDIRMVSEGSLSWLLGQQKPVDEGEAGFILDIHKYYSDLIAFKGENLFDSCLISQGADFLAKGKENIEHFINEFKQTREMLPEGLLEKFPNSLFITGVGARYPQLKESLAKEFNLKVSRKDPGRDFPVDASFTGLLGIGHKSLIRTIVFDVPEIKVKKLWRRKLRQLILLGALLAYVIVISLVILGFRIYKSQEELLRIQSDYSRYAKDAEKLSVLMQKIRIIRDIKSPQKGLAYLLYTVSEVLPSGCRVVSINFQKKSQLVIKGEAQAVSLVFDFISLLEETKVFSNVKTTYTRKMKGKASVAKGSEFEIVCSLK